MAYLMILQNKYTLPILFGAVELACLIVILNLILMLHRKYKNLESDRQGIRMYQDAVCTGVEQAHFLVDQDDMRVVYFSDNFEQMTGMDPVRVRDDLEVLGEYITQDIFKPFWKSYRKWDHNGALTQEYASSDEPVRWIRISVTAQQGGCDLFVFRDISEDKCKLMQLEDHLEQAEEASQSKTTFLSRMSHEIRTPINGIIGMLSLARKQVAPDSLVDGYLDKAENLSAHLISLVNDILDMSRIEAGKIELEDKAFDLRQLAENLRGMFQENVEAKGLRFEIEMLDFDNTCVIGDAFRLTQVIVNFLSNAVKFTDQGEIRVTFRQMMKENGYMDLMIRVHDTGKGMEPEFVKRIFQPFEQENADIAKHYGGSGLGMAISDQIVRLMGGEIIIDSMPGRGSDFMLYLHLPVADASMVETDRAYPMQQAVDDGYSYADKCILLAEDNEINAQIAQEILGSEGAHVEIAENGQAAVDMFAGHPAGYYDFILMDIQMPVMDGREATRQIRKLPREDAGSILIFALSADAFLENVRMSLDAGMDAHFAKPVAFDKIRVEIGRIVNMRREADKR